MSGTTEHALIWPAVHWGALLSLQSRFTLRVPPKESMLRHIRKSSRLIKPLIFCDAGILLNTIYRDSGAKRRTQCVFYGETLLILRKMSLSCGYGHYVVYECVCVLVWLVCSREWEKVCVWVCRCVCGRGGTHSHSPGQTHCYKYSILMVTLWCCLCETMAPQGPLPHSLSPPSSPFPFSLFLFSATIFSCFSSFRIYGLTG